jgi:Escherichia/Staphylococcus phage prohead protease
MSTEERRDLAWADAGMRLRAAGDDGAQRFAGLASPFGVRAPIGNPKTWGFFEEFVPGCYIDSLGADDQRKLIDHDSYYVVSRVSAGTLTLAESPRGLEVDSALDTSLSYVNDLVANIRNRNVTGMSIGFRVPVGGDEWLEIEVEEPRPDGRVEVYSAELRRVHTVELLEVSSVTWPAFVSTEAQLRYQLGPALVGRGDYDAIARRAATRPDLGDLLQLVTRGIPAPAAPTSEDLDRVMRGYRARYPRLGHPAR